MIDERRYNRALSIAIFISEGHTLNQAIEEFRISSRTIYKDLNFLATYGYGDEADRNVSLYLKAITQLQANKIRKSC